jgi:hypothetical protein
MVELEGVRGFWILRLLSFLRELSCLVKKLARKSASSLNSRQPAVGTTRENSKPEKNSTILPRFFGEKNWERVMSDMR